MKTLLFFAATLFIGPGAMAQSDAEYQAERARRQAARAYGEPTDAYRSGTLPAGQQAMGQPGYWSTQPGQVNRPLGRNRFDADRQQDLFRLRQINQLVNLTGWQKRDLLRLENFYDQQLNAGAWHPAQYQQLMWQKSQDALAVLSPFQRRQLLAYQEYQAFGPPARQPSREFPGQGWGPPAGRRW